MSNLTSIRAGYVEDDSGFSGSFSWWRSDAHYPLWRVVAHTQFGKNGLAVTDDFGTLVEVTQ